MLSLQIKTSIRVFTTHEALHNGSSSDVSCHRFPLLLSHSEDCCQFLGSVAEVWQSILQPDVNFTEDLQNKGRVSQFMPCFILQQCLGRCPPKQLRMSLFQTLWWSSACSVFHPKLSQIQFTCDPVCLA